MYTYIVSNRGINDLTFHSFSYKTPVFAKLVNAAIKPEIVFELKIIFILSVRWNFFFFFF